MIRQTSSLAHHPMRAFGLLLSLMLLAGAEPAICAEDIQLENLSVDAGAVAIAIPKAALTASSLSRADLDKLIKSGNATDLIKSLAALSARKIDIPALTLTFRPGGSVGQKRVLSLTELTFEGIKSGVADKAHLSSAKLTGNDGTGEAGAASAARADLQTLAALVTGTTLADGAHGLAQSLDAASLALTSPGVRLAADHLLIREVAVHHGVMTSPQVTGDATLTGVAADIDGKENQKRHWTVKGLQAALGIASASQALSLTLMMDELTTDPSVLKDRGFADLGYDQLVLSARIKAGFEPASGSLKIDTVQLDAPLVGAMSLSGQLTGLSKDAFYSGKTSAALAPSRVKSMAITLENKGFYERLVIRDAKAAGRSLDEQKQRAGNAGRSFVLTLFGQYMDTPLLPALLSFVNKPGKLTIRSEAKSPDGVPYSDFGAKNEKGKPKITDAFTISASNE